MIFLCCSCSKEEADNDFIWKKSFGHGEACFVVATSDSGFVACGHSGGKPFLVKFNGKREEVITVSPDFSGLFSSCIADTTGFITAGCRGADLLLMRHDINGNLLWEDTLRTGFNVESASLLPYGDNLLVVASPDHDSLSTGDNGFMIAVFDTTGRLLTSEKVISDYGYIAVADVDTDEAGNIYIARTDKIPGTKSCASVAAYSSDFNKIWETILFNNPAFSSASLTIDYDETGNVFLGGRTEVSGPEEKVVNAFVAAVSREGAYYWPQKKYLELWNEACSVMHDEEGNLLMLNKNCFIINIINPSDGSDAGMIRPFSLCVSETTDAFASAFDIMADHNIVISGSLGGNFFVAVESAL